MKYVPNIAQKNILIKHYWRATRRAFAQTRVKLTDMAEYMDPERLKDNVPHLLDRKVMNENVIAIWERVGAKYAYDTERAMLNSKGVFISLETKDGKQKLAEWQKRMRAYASERSLAVTNSIMDTEEQAINSIIDKVLSRVNAEGLSVPDARRLMQDELADELVTIENYQAERIARTEVNSASNFGSFEAASEYGEGVEKTWVLSNLMVKHRESHVTYDQMGSQPMDFEYAPGLKFPGDPDCEDGGEVINCLCYYTLDTIN
jgi:hypothetical protein